MAEHSDTQQKNSAIDIKELKLSGEMNNASSQLTGPTPSFNHHIDPVNAVHHHIEKIQFPTTEKVKGMILRALKGALMGALGILVPALLYYRKRPAKGIQTKALALATFLGGSRLLDGIINFLAAHSDRYYNSFRLAIADTSNNNNRKKVYQVPKPSVARIILKLMQENSFAVSTGLASGAAMLIDDALCNSVVVLWLLIRALRYYVPSIPGGSIIIMSLSASQILSTWIRAPDQHSPSYLKFLDHQGGKPRSKLNLARQDRPTLVTACQLIHPADDCWQHPLTFFPEGLRRALPVYLPIHMLSFVLQTWNRRATLSVPMLINQLKFTAVGLLRSCSFLSAYCTIAWLSACVYYRFFPGVTREALFAHTWAAGLALLIERPSRRPELAAYCLTQALNSCYTYAKVKSWVKPRQSVTIFAIIVSVGLIVFQHKNSKLLMQLLFGRYPTSVVLRDHHAKPDDKTNTAKSTH